VEDLASVRLKGGAEEIEIVSFDDTVIHFNDSYGANARVNRQEFLAAVTDYEYRKAEGEDVAKVRKGGGNTTAKPTARSVEDLMAELEKGISL